jgi:CHAT domain-containing protein
LRDGLPTARALREAKLAQRAARGLRGRHVDEVAQPLFTAGHPYFWASCVYVGLPDGE